MASRRCCRHRGATAWIAALDEAARADEGLRAASRGRHVVIGQEVRDGDVAHRWHVVLDDGEVAVRSGAAPARRRHLLPGRRHGAAPSPPASWSARTAFVMGRHPGGRRRVGAARPRPRPRRAGRRVRRRAGRRRRRPAGVRLMPELPEVQAHAERLDADFGGAVLAGFRPITFTALKTFAPAPEAAVGRPLAAVRPAGQVPAARLRRRHLRRPPDAGRPPQARREAVGQAPRRHRPLDLRRRPGPPAHRGRHRAQGRRVGRRRATPRPRSRSTASGPRPTRSTPPRCSTILRRGTPAAPRRPARPARSSPASGGGWPTRSATGPGSRRSP